MTLAGVRKADPPKAVTAINGKNKNGKSNRYRDMKNP
jgi:hypothetical protein